MPCPANTTGTVIPGAGCPCRPGYSGAITASTFAPNYYTGSCQPVPCPNGTVGTNLPSGCICDMTSYGTVNATASPPYYVRSCVPCSNVTVAVGSILYRTVGTYTFTVPACWGSVTSISVVAIGGGGGGATYGATTYRNGNAGSASSVTVAGTVIVQANGGSGGTSSGAVGPALIPALQQTGRAELVWAVLVAVPLILA